MKIIWLDVSRHVVGVLWLCMKIELSAAKRKFNSEAKLAAVTCHSDESSSSQMKVAVKQIEW